MILGLLNVAVLTQDFMKLRIKCKNDHEYWVGKDLESSGCGMFKDAYIASADCL
jgi:hypothetical protein